MDTSATPSLKTQPQPTPSQVESNPFTTVLTSMQALWQYNPVSFIASQLLLFGVSLILVFLSFWLTLLFAAVFGAITNQGSINFPLYEFFNSPVAIVFGVLGLLALLAVLGYTQAMILGLAGSTANRHSIGFGPLLSLSMRRCLAVLGQFGLVFIGLALTAIVAILLGQLSVPAAVVFIVISLLVGAFLGVRTSLAGFVVVHEEMGPLKAMARSWKLTKGHFFEVVGVMAAFGIIVLLPLAFIDLISTLAGTNAIGILLQILVALANVVSSTLVLVALAERYRQFKATPTEPPHKTFHANYWAPLVFIAGIAIIGFLTPQPPAQPTELQSPFMQDSNELPNDYESSPEDDYYNNSEGTEPEAEPPYQLN